MLDSTKMLSFEHDHESNELMQLLCFSPEQQSITLIPEAGQAKSTSSKKRKSENDQSPEDCLKKIVHREVERKRRQEMSSLYTSLRSILPKEYLLKKSISNDMHGAANYINHLKEKLDALKNKRDELKKSIDSGSCKENRLSFDHENTSFKVQCQKTGIEVILKTCSRKGFPLSKLLSALNGEGMSILSCTSTRIDEALIHVIESEMDEGRIFDQNELQKRLSDMVLYK